MSETDYKPVFFVKLLDRVNLVGLNPLPRDPLILKGHKGLLLDIIIPIPNLLIAIQLRLLHNALPNLVIIAINIQNPLPNLLTPPMPHIIPPIRKSINHHLLTFFLQYFLTKIPRTILEVIFAKLLE
jgi:hypothetical protein